MREKCAPGALSGQLRQSMAFSMKTPRVSQFHRNWHTENIAKTFAIIFCKELKTGDSNVFQLQELFCQLR
jgi:hypothetical protein